MSVDGFWAGGSDEHRLACQRHISNLQRRLAECKAEDRAQLENELEDARKALREAGGAQVLW